MFVDSFAHDRHWEQRVHKPQRAVQNNPLISPTTYMAPSQPLQAMPPCPIRPGFRQWPYEIPRLSGGQAFSQLGAVLAPPAATARAEPLIFSGGFGTCQRIGHLHRGPSDPTAGAGMAAWRAPSAARPTTVTVVEPISPNNASPNAGMKSFAESFASPRRNHLALQQESPIFRPGAVARPRADLSPRTWQASRSWQPAGTTEQSRMSPGMGGFR